MPLRIEFLFDEIPEDVLRRRLPPFVWEHDAELEEHPLIDYGIAADKTTIPGLEVPFPDNESPARRAAELEEELERMKAGSSK